MMAKRVRKHGAKQVKAALLAQPGEKPPIPGPSTNAVTNLIISDIVMRGSGRLMRMAMEKGLLRTRLDPHMAKDIVENRSLIASLATYGVTRLATRSVPGALAVGGSLLVKTLFDRSQSKRKVRRANTKALRKAAKEK